MIEIWENEVVGRNSGRAIYRCPVSGVPAPRGGRVSPATRGGKANSRIYDYVNAGSKFIRRFHSHVWE